MRKIANRVVAGVLALILTVGLASNVGFQTYAGKVMSDDFSSSALSGWKRQDVGTVRDGRYILSAGESNYLSRLGSKGNITVEGDVSFSADMQADGADSSLASIYACGSEDLGRAYEFGIGISRSGVSFVRLYLRAGADDSRILYQSSKDIPGTKNGKIVQKTVYHLKLGVSQGEVRCFLNDTLICAIKDATLTEGYIGIKSVAAEATFDNMVVNDLGEKLPVSIKAVDIPSSISTVSKLEFNLVVDYGEYWGTETISSDSDGVTLSGFERKAGTQAITVSYKGKSDTFSLNVLEKYKGATIYKESFSSEANDFTLSTKTNEAANFKYAFAVENECLVAKYPDNIGSFNEVAQITATLDPTQTSKWLEQYKNYKITVDVSLKTAAKTAKKRSAIGEIVFATDSAGQQYKFRIDETGKASLYLGSLLLSARDVESYTGTKIELGKTYTLGVEIRENFVLLTVNGKGVLRRPIELSNLNPCLLLAAYNGTVVFDEINVITLENRAPEAAVSMRLQNAESLQQITEYKGSTLDISNMYLRVEYLDGTAVAVGITWDMVSGYTQGKSSTVTIHYGNLTAKLDYQYMECLFIDSFTDGMHADWNINENKQYKTSVSKGELKISCTYPGKSTILRGTVKTGEEWTNYSVSADFRISADARRNSYMSYCGIIGRVSGNNYYEFRLRQSVNTISGMLYKFVDGKEAELLQTFTSNQLSSLLEEKNLSTGTSYNMRMTMVGNTIYLFFDNELLYVYADDSDTVITAGTAGFKVVNYNGTMDNFLVQEISSSNFTAMEILGAENNCFELYEGQDIEIQDYVLRLSTAKKDFVIDIPLTEEMISPYDNLEVGTQNIKIDCSYYTGSAKVKISQRREMITELDHKLKELDVKALTEADREMVDGLRREYDTFSVYETSLLSEEATENLKEANLTLDQLLYPEITEYDLLLYDDKFADGTIWREGREHGIGKAAVRNGYYAFDQRSYNLSGNSMMSADVYGKLAAVTADFMMVSDNSLVGLKINEESGGYYHTRITSKTRDENDEVIHTLQLYRYTDSHRLLDSVATEVYDLEIADGEWFNMMLTFTDGLLRVYVNGQMLLEYDDSDSLAEIKVGEAGLRVSEGNARVDNVRIYGISMERPEQVAEPYVYTDDFEDEEVGKRPGHWIEHATSEGGMEEHWKVYSMDGSNVYGTGYTGRFTHSYLHVFDKNPTTELDFLATGLQSGAQIGFEYRVAPESTYVRIGYDVSQARWFVLCCMGDESEDTLYWSEKTYILKSGEWHKACVEFDEKNMVFTVDSEPVFTFEKGEIPCDGYGRLGVFANGAGMYIDNYKAILTAGNAPTDGVLEYTFGTDGQEDANNSAEIQELPNGDLIYVQQSGKNISRSTDGGDTWVKQSNLQNLSLMEGLSGYTCFTQLKDGSYLWVEEGTYIVRISTDMLNWRQIGRVLEEDEIYDESNRQQYLLHVDSLREVEFEDGSTRIFLPMIRRMFPANSITADSLGNYQLLFYSDDNGVTWQQSETDGRDLLYDWDDTDTNNKWGESKILLCPDGVLRMYCSRSKSGCIIYTESRNRGETWEGVYTIPELQCATSSMALSEDPYEPGTYYLVWVNDTPMSYGNLMYRTRISIARSHDGLNWEFLCDLERMCVRYHSNPSKTSPLYQILDPAILITEDSIHVTFGRAGSYDPLNVKNVGGGGYHGIVTNRYVRLRKDALTASKWSAANLANVKFTKSLELTELPDKVKFGYGEIFAVVGGKVTLTALDGTITEKDLSSYSLYNKPDMYTYGTRTLLFYDQNYMSLKLDISVVDKYNVTWNISENGTVKPQEKTVLEGDDFTFELVPNAGYQVAAVTVNGEKLAVSDGKATVKNVSSDLDIVVAFEPGMSRVIPILCGVLATLVLAAVVVAIVLIRRRRGKVNMKDNVNAEGGMCDDEEKKNT